MSTSIHHFLSPNYFISYSREQEAIACKLKSAIGRGARQVWFDRDQIMPGDEWFATVCDGIDAADELVLLLSDESLASRVVEDEVRFALGREKLIRPIAVTAISRPYPDYLRDLHVLNLAQLTPHDLHLRLSEYFGVPPASVRPDAKLKILACRHICPQFELAFASSEGRLRAQSFAGQLDGLKRNYPRSSTIRLNAGLMHCVAGRWDEGLASLREYAHAANNLPGWYFLALHLTRGRPVLNLPLAAVKEALQSIEKALSFGPNPLVVLTAAVLETGGDNRGLANLQRRMGQLADAMARQTETPGEFLRALWCLKPSLPLLGRYEEPVKAMIRGMVQ